MCQVGEDELIVPSLPLGRLKLRKVTSPVQECQADSSDQHPGPAERASSEPLEMLHLSGFYKSPGTKLTFGS